MAYNIPANACAYGNCTKRKYLLPKRSADEPETGDLTDRPPKNRLERRLEGLVIQDITEAADVGYGSFYTHFTSKEAIVAAVIDAGRRHAKDIYHRLGEHTSDRAEAFALELLACLHLSKADKTWGWFVIRTVLSGEQPRSGIGGDIARSLDACVREGVLRPDLEMAYEITSGLLLVGTLKLLRYDLPDDYPVRLVRIILQHLGLSDAKTNSILSKPFPELNLTPFLEAAA
jgi:AcrR family transcriptional regulator